MKRTQSLVKAFFFPIVALAIAVLVQPAAAVPHHDSITAPGTLPESGNSLDAGPEQKEGFHIPVIFNNSVEAAINCFVRRKAAFQKGLNNAMPYLPLMQKIFRQENLPEELVYIVMIESWFNPVAVSRTSAAGLWQFMAGTARQYGLLNDKWVDERMDNLKSTRAAARYLRALHDRLGSWTLAVAAYNAGPGTVLRAVKHAGSEDYWDLTRSAYLQQETKNYVPRFMAAAIIARDPAAYGFTVPGMKPAAFDIVEISKSTDLRSVANDIHTTYASLRFLNPEIKGRFTPPRTYLLRVPHGKRKVYIAKRGASGREPEFARLSNPSLAYKRDRIRARSIRGTRMAAADETDLAVAE